MIKYIGSKRKLVAKILDCISTCKPSGTVLDPFSGTARVGHALKRAGYSVLSSDHNAYGAAIAKCYVEADSERWAKDATRLIAELQTLSGVDGYFTETFCRKSRFFQEKNGARIDAIREEIKRKSLDPELEAVLLVSLMEAADRVDSTVGLQMAYLKKWAARAENDLQLRVPDLLPRASSGPGIALQADIMDVVHADVDVVYLDPPYNQHKYIGNYHIWESLVVWDKPEVYGVACKRVDCKTRQSDFNSKVKAEAAFETMLDAVRAPNIVLSYSDEGFVGKERIEKILARKREVQVVSVGHDRYIGSKIGIYNLEGERVGVEGKSKNTEYLFVARTA